MRRALNQNGVALVEILIAALILSVSILGTLRLVTSSQQAVTDSGVIAEAQTIAGAVMEVSRYDYSPTNWASRVEDFQTARASVDFAVDSFSERPDTSVNTVSAKVSWSSRELADTQDFVVVQSASPHVFSHQSVATIKATEAQPASP